MKTFDLGFGCLGNGTTVWDRNQDTGNDYKTVAHIAAYGGVKLYDQRLKTSPEALRRIIDMKYITFACLNQGYTMPAELEIK